MRLRTTLVGLLVVVAVVLTGTIYVGFALHKQDIVAQERTELETAATTVATSLENSLTERRGLVELWARNEGIRAHGTATQDRALASFVEETSFNGGSVVVPNGTMVALRSEGTPRTDELAVIGEVFSDRAYVRAALNGSTYVSQPFEAESGPRLVVISTPIRTEKGITGVFTGSFHLTNGSLFRESVGLARTEHRITVTAGGTTLYDGGGGDGATMRASDDVGVSGWTVTATQPEASFGPRLRQATLVQIGAALVALLSIGAIGAWISHSTLTQIEQLVDGLDELERGSYSQRLGLAATDEWESISDQYNALSDTLQQRESQLQVLNRVLRHNLRNDMNVVTAHAEKVLARDDLPDGADEDIEKIHATARRLIDTSDHARALYEDLLSDDERDPEPVDVAGIVRTRIGPLRDEFPDCTIETSLSEGSRVLDTQALPIVVEELIHNAIVHNDKPEAERRVEVTVETVGESTVRIEVTDNGPGIPMVEEALLTEGLEETPVEHGSGLGVWLVNWLVSTLGGSIEAHSAIGRGTTVTVEFPAAPE